MADPSTVPVSSTGMALPDSSNQQATAASGVGLLSELLNQKRQSDASVVDLMHKAATPVPVSAPTPPELAISSQPRFQPQPLDKREVVGHHNAKVQGISNTIIGATNLIGQVEQKQKDEKNRRLAVDIEHIYGAVDGMQEAQAALQQDPNNADAKATLQKNQQLIDSILSDPKKRKQVAVAFDINFTDPSKNDKPEHQAMKMATESYSQQLAKKLPTRLAPNTAAQEQLKIAVQQNKQLGEQLNQAGKIQELQTLNNIRQQGADEKERHNEAIEQTATDKLVQQKQLREETLANQWKIAQNSTNTRIKVASIAAASHIQGVQMTTENRLAVVDKMQADPVHAAKVYQKNLEDQTNLVKWIPQAINQADQLLKTKGITKEEHDQIVAPLKTQLEKTQQDISETQATIETLGLMADEKAKEGGKSNANNTGSSSKPVPKQSSSSSSKPAVAEAPTAGDSDSSHY